MHARFIASALCLLLLPTAASASSISGVYVFGDSLSDDGNAFLLTGGAFPPPPYAGRASNGAVAVEILAASLGLTLTPAAHGGTDYAVVGAATGVVGASDNSAAVTYGIPALDGTGIMAQAALFALSMPMIDPSALFVVWGGPNDFSLSPSPATAVSAVSNLVNTIGLLYSLGARNFLVPDMPDLALTPASSLLPPDERAGLHLLTIGFNDLLSTALGSLMLPGATLTPFKTYDLLNEITAHPSLYGLSNVTDACLGGDIVTGYTVCSDPSSYLFWDSLHPTTAAHAILGRAFADAVAPVPEPATLALFGVGAAVAAVRARRRPRP